jgi:hypothetical protein
MEKKTRFSAEYFALGTFKKQPAEIHCWTGKTVGFH